MAGTSKGRRAGAANAARFSPNQAAIRDLMSDRAGPVGKELARRAIRVDRIAKRLCPVDTGRLRASIAWRAESDAEGLSVVVGTNVEYAPWVELGTSTQPARPYLRPALQEGGRS